MGEVTVMFDWFKSKKKEAQKTKTEEKSESLTSPEEVQELIQRDLEKIKATSDAEVLAKLYEQVGVYYWQLDSVDEAIEYLEKSQELKPSMGEGYKKLMLLYNSKRAEAAKNRDDAGIDYYMNKLDDMRNLAKKLTLSR